MLDSRLYKSVLLPRLLLQDSYLRAPSGSLRNLLLDREFWECKAELEKQTQKVADLQEELEGRIKENANLGKPLKSFLDESALGHLVNSIAVPGFSNHTLTWLFPFQT